MNEEISYIAKEDLAALLEARAINLIDVRLNWQTSQEKIKNAVYENPEDTASWAAKYRKDQPLVLYCSTPEQKTSRETAQVLMNLGFKNVRVLRGGWTVWQSAGMPVQKRTPSPTPKGLVKDVMTD